MSPADVTYGYYADVYHGSAIAEEDWDGYAARAAAYLARLDALYTVEPYGDDGDAAWSMALCAVVEQYQTIDVAAGAATGSGGPVSSASIGSVSVGYGTALAESVDLSPQGQGRMLLDGARLYLHVFAGGAQWSR